jgi:hypothetical protein
MNFKQILVIIGVVTIIIGCLRRVSDFEELCDGRNR